MSTQTYSGSFSSDAATYIAQKTLDIALKRLAIYQLAEKAPLPKNNSRTFQYTRYERLALPQVKLSEGVTPSDTGMTISTVPIVMDQWGAVIPISDVAIDSVKHPVLQKAIELMGHQAQETVDRECAKIALSGSNVFYVNSANTYRAQIAATDYVVSASIGRVVANMRDAGAIPFDEDLFVGVVDSFVNEDMTLDATFLDAAKYGMIKKLMVNEIGEWKGVRWVRSNALPKLGLAVGASAATSATGGSLSNATTYDCQLTVVDAMTGFETFSTAVISTGTAGNSSIDVTVPALPAGATAGSTFNLYFGANAGVLYLAQTGLAASSNANQKTVPVSGSVAPAVPNTGFKTHFSLIMGKGALACVELSKIQSYLTPAVPSDSDPLVQRRKCGWKGQFKAAITNDAFIARLESAARYG